MEEVKVVGVIDGSLRVELSGDIDLSNAERFYETVASAYGENPANLLFDCVNLQFIDSTTLGTFVKLLKTAKANGHTVKLVGLQSKIKKLFLICALDSVMEIA